MTPDEIKGFQQRYAQMLADAHIVLTERERQNIEVADMGLGDLERSGLGLVTYENNSRYCAKEIILFPRQTCPQHKHPPIEDDAGRLIDPGKRETFRCRRGEVYLYVEGEAAGSPKASPPAGSEAHYTVWHEVVLRPGQQYTIEPGIWHWFQAGDEGVVVSEFSSTSRDDADIFADPRIRRVSDEDQ